MLFVLLCGLSGFQKLHPSIKVPPFREMARTKWKTEAATCDWHRWHYSMSKWSRKATDPSLLLSLMESCMRFSEGLLLKTPEWLGQITWGFSRTKNVSVTISKSSISSTSVEILSHSERNWYSLSLACGNQGSRGLTCLSPALPL